MNLWGARACCPLFAAFCCESGWSVPQAALLDCASCEMRPATCRTGEQNARAPRPAAIRTISVANADVLLCAFLSLTAFAQSDAEFAKANQEYAQGHFKEAIAGYEALVRAGQWNANLFYDLGNAYFRTRDFGRAILNYERALALDQSSSGGNR